ncbi:MAG: proline dehydrogenase family protein [Bacteroidales bacterium]|nr:proline dehydrogenase family protein [Bacteroidales bacterium]
MFINKAIAAIIPYFPKKFIWLFSKRYIAGERIGDAIEVSKALNNEGIKVSIDFLGEFIINLNEVQPYQDQYIELIHALEENKIDGNYSLKPTMFGLLIDKEQCYKNIRTIVELASRYNRFIRLDMEDSQCVDLELELFKKLFTEFPANVGIVLQAYLRRTYSDIKALINSNPHKDQLNIRLCKGIYQEPKEIAYKDHDRINENYLLLLDYMFQNKCYTGIATHDGYLIEESYRLINKYNLTTDEYEFQMLYGVTPELRKTILSNGHNMRVYVPFGEKWFGYSTRRLRENPRMVSQIIKAIFIKK